MLLAALAILFSCTNKLISPDEKIVQIKRYETQQKLSDLAHIQGFTAFPANTEIDLRNINKLLFKDGKVIVLNFTGDAQDLWVFDEKTGQMLHRIGRQTNEPEGYDGMNDVMLKGSDLCISAAGKMAFMQYGMDGAFQSSLKSGIFGEEIELTNQGEIVAYNEFNATEISGLNHLVFYDKNGNVVKRMYPYLKAQDGNGFAFAGSLTASNGLWFNPPFSDTVFEISGRKLYPQFIFDFGEKAMPMNVRNQKLDGWDTDNYSYLSESMVKVGNFLVFKYHDEHKLKLGIFDEISGRFAAFRDMQPDGLHELFQLGDLYPKDEYTFALLLRPNRIQYLQRKNMIDMNILRLQYPELAMALSNYSAESGPIALYIRLKPETRL